MAICTLQPLLRHAEEAGKAAGGSTLFIFTSDHGDGYTDKGHAYEPSNPNPKPTPRPKPKPKLKPKPKPNPCFLATSSEPSRSLGVFSRASFAI